MRSFFKGGEGEGYMYRWVREAWKVGRRVERDLEGGEVFVES